MPRKALYLVSVFLLTTLMFTALTPVQAADAVVGFTLGCTGFTAKDGNMLLDRDNTGIGREAFVVSAVDGIGIPVFEARLDSFFVGGTVSWRNGEFFNWTRIPRYNPITFHITSPAGNRQPQQIVYETVGYCDGLPDATQAMLDAIGALTSEFVTKLLPADGRTGVSVPLNSVPPRPTNPEGFAEAQAGYAIVNIDNLYLRTGPSAKYSIVGILDGGTKLVVLGKSKIIDEAADYNNLWWYVQVGGTRGWVTNEFLYLRGDLTAVPVVPVLGELQPPSLYVGFTGNWIYPDPVAVNGLCTITGNLEYKVVGQTEGSTWWQIEATCGGSPVTGWIQAERGLLRNFGGVEIPVTS